MARRILVAEDSATQAEVLRALLEEHAYEVTVARSGEAALDRIATEEFDLVISDVIMPGITGYDLCRRLKQHPQWYNLPVLLLTSQTDPMDIVRGLECGADNYITKPYNPEQLLARIRHVLDNRSLRRRSPSGTGITVQILGKDLTITSEKEQILDLFVSSVEDVVRANEALQRSQRELAEVHARLEAYAREKEREARISTERYRILMRNAGDAIFVLDLQGKILEANRGAAILMERSVDELVNQSLETLVAAESQGEFRARFSRIAEQGQVHLGEHRFSGESRGEVWCDLTASSTPLDHETLILLIARDITQRKRAEQVLHEINQQLSTLIEASPLGIVALDQAGKVRLWNAAAERIFGWSEEEVLGGPFPAAQAERLEEHHDLCRRVFQGESLAGVETQRIRRDGSPVEVSISAAPLRASTGEIVGAMGVIADITERKQMQSRAREREEAERANHAKSEFLSRMSHELRTPMNAILGFAQLLNMDELDEEQQESVDQILTAGRHLLALIDEVLDLSRIEAGKLSLSLEAVSLDEVVRETVGLIRPLATQRGISIQTEPELLTDHFVHADPKRLRQVLLNLLSNAAKYSHANGSVTVFVAETEANWLRIGVRDAGPGMSAQQLERLFVPFERLDAERSEVQGTGLGLALSRSLVDAMGGRIGVESTVGEGSTFWVELPRTENPAKAPPFSEAEPTGASQAGAPDAVSYVLYIENNLSNLRLVERMLKNRPQIRLLVAMQGNLGLELAHEHQPDLILVDLDLPDLSGLEVLQRLQASPELREIPVVVVSSDTRPEQMTDLRQQGMADFLVKPFDIWRFLDVVDSNVARVRAVRG